MCWIKASIAHILFQSPHIVVVCFGEIAIKQRMDVSTFSVNDITEVTLSGHIQRHEFEKIITTVFEYHAMLLCFLRGFYQLPAFFNSNRSGYFGCSMFPVLHG